MGVDKTTCDLYCSPNIVGVAKSRRMRRAWHVARIVERCIQGFGGETRWKESTTKTQA